MVLHDPNLRFYAGQPIAAPGGEPLGTLCVFDDRVRDVTDFDTEALAELAGMVEAEIASLSLAIGDELTGLSNRRGFEMLGERLLAAARRLELPVSAIYADLDNLKPINDIYGHDAGDKALIDTAAVLAASMRASDLIARLGGDEFCALLVGAAVGRRPDPDRAGGGEPGRAATPPPTIPGSSRSASASPKARPAPRSTSGTWSPAPTPR